MISFGAMATALSASVWDVVVPVRQRLTPDDEKLYEFFGRHVLYVYGEGRDMILVVRRKLSGGDAMLLAMCGAFIQQGIPAFLAPPLKSYVFSSE
jgi:hypothetical protein